MAASDSNYKMRMQRGNLRPNTSSQVYKKPERMTFFETVLHYLTTFSRSSLAFMRHGGWILTSAFVILVMPSALTQMFEYESLLSKGLDQ